jgi:hypothetical protein
MSKQTQGSIVEPTEEELVIYKQLTQHITDEQMDELVTDYFIKVSEESLDVSFPRFLITKMVRPIQPADTITVQVEGGENTNLFCLLRKTIEGKDYLLFAFANAETEELDTTTVYLFFVDGIDEIGTEIIDILPSGPEAERILDIMEADVDKKDGE